MKHCKEMILSRLTLTMKITIQVELRMELTSYFHSSNHAMEFPLHDYG